MAKKWKPRRLSKVNGEMVQRNVWIDPQLSRRLDLHLAAEGLTARAWLEQKIWEDAGNIEVRRTRTRLNPDN